MGFELNSEDGWARVSDLANGRRRIDTGSEPERFVARPSCVTDYPDELIKAIWAVRGAAYLCDEILRDQSPDYVTRSIENGVLSFIEPRGTRGKRIIDFGCGAGASTCILARKLPAFDIVGVEPEPRLLSVAQKRIDHYGLNNVYFLQSSFSETIPEGIGTFDYIILSAVYEHLLEHERETLLPRIWSLLNENGILFINQTPHRYFPVEYHTTGLPFINYLPKSAAFWAARRLSKRIDRKVTWEDLLRSGIRGATEKEIMKILDKEDGGVQKIPPIVGGFKDDIELWFASTTIMDGSTTKEVIRTFCRILRVLCGISIIPSLTLALKKN
jgi:2-polyprenyl-3-methyl-5-hydroxy-6-metoxy-1,4-benzoquinol methylase